MRLADQGPQWCANALRGAGLAMRLGPFRVRARSSIASLGDDLFELYGEHRLSNPDEVCDFDVELEPAGGLRRFWHPQAIFRSDGFEPFHPLPLEQVSAFFEWGLNWCIASHAHDRLIIHAAVLAKGDRGLVLPAPSGAGKSTLTAALALSGWRLLTDELAMVDLETGELQALARPINLKNNSIDIIARHFPQARFAGISDGTAKGKVGLLRPPDESVHEALKPARVTWVVLPRYLAGNPTRFSPLSPPRALIQLAENAMNYSIHGRAGFDLMCRMVDRAQNFTLLYSDLDDVVRTFDELAANEDGS
ncbi:MAG: HprK-related kinase A [Geminicoccaceae bacterium]